MVRKKKLALTIRLDTTLLIFGSFTCLGLGIGGGFALISRPSIRAVGSDIVTPPNAAFSETHAAPNSTTHTVDAAPSRAEPAKATTAPPQHTSMEIPQQTTLLERTRRELINLERGLDSAPAEMQDNFAEKILTTLLSLGNDAKTITSDPDIHRIADKAQSHSKRK